MARTKTKWTSLTTLKNRGKLGTVVVKLMLAANDMSLANQSQEYWRGVRAASQDMRARGALQYFHRMQVAHLFEAIAIIQQIADDIYLTNCVKRCDPQTIKSFDALKGTSKNSLVF